jgi:hypothetical protein
MNLNRTPDEESRLNQLLREWQVGEPLPPRFQEQVWQRIDRARSEPRLGVLGWLAQWVESLVPRPRFAVAYVAVLLAFGLAGGAWTAQRTNHRLNSELGKKYVQSIDPYQHTSMGQ